MGVTQWDRQLAHGTQWQRGEQVIFVEAFVEDRHCVEQDSKSTRQREVERPRQRHSDASIIDAHADRHRHKHKQPLSRVARPARGRHHCGRDDRSVGDSTPCIMLRTSPSADPPSAIRVRTTRSSTPFYSLLQGSSQLFLSPRTPSLFSQSAPPSQPASASCPGLSCAWIKGPAGRRRNGEKGTAALGREH